MYKEMAKVPLVVDRPETAVRATMTTAEGIGGEVKTAGWQAPDIGQVRLLHPAYMDIARMRPIYVAVLRRAGETSWLVAPFSRFARSAVPGELQTCLRAAPLRVLCLWNARIVNQEAMAATWLCRRIAAAQVVSALKVWLNFSEGKPLQQALVSRVGPPLEHPLDPRHDYMQEELELLDAHLGPTSSEVGRSAALVYAMPESELRRAAEFRSEYGNDGEG
jgi:hypothetical protein